MATSSLNEELESSHQIDPDASSSPNSQSPDHTPLNDKENSFSFNDDQEPEPESSQNIDPDTSSSPNSQLSNHTSLIDKGTSSSTQPNWVQSISRPDNRSQPWRQISGISEDDKFEEGKDFCELRGGYAGSLAA